MSELLYEFSIFFGNGKKHILHHRGMKPAGGGAGGNDMFYIKENGGTVLNCHHIIQQHTAFRCNVCLAKNLADGDAAENTAISPVIILLDVKRPFHQNDNVA